MSINLKVPTIHLNGTSRESLMEAISDASGKLADAITALAGTEPHGRDYYLQGPDAFKQAQQEYQSRLQRLQSVQSELMRIGLTIVDV